MCTPQHISDLTNPWVTTSQSACQRTTRSLPPNNTTTGTQTELGARQAGHPTTRAPTTTASPHFPSPVSAHRLVINRLHGVRRRPHRTGQQSKTLSRDMHGARCAWASSFGLNMPALLRIDSLGTLLISTYHAAGFLKETEAMASIGCTATGRPRLLMVPLSTLPFPSPHGNERDSTTTGKKMRTQPRHLQSGRGLQRKADHS
jgi:hypothetical protein